MRGVKWDEQRVVAQEDGREGAVWECRGIEVGTENLGLVDVSRYERRDVEWYYRAVKLAGTESRLVGLWSRIVVYVGNWSFV